MTSVRTQARVTESPTQRARRALEDLDAAARPDLWIGLHRAEDVLDAALEVERRLAAEEDLPLAGTILAVKDNIDVAGLATTAGCPAFAYHPDRDAPAVERLRDAGAVVLGKTNLDQFATGLVGTRSPYGAVADARDPARVAGGSSSGSAVAVALGIADLALATDTAGSGRVPAAFQGIVGIKPTRGLISARGVVPACRSFDCVSVFSATVAAGQRAATLAARPDPADPLQRTTPADAPLGASPRPRLAIPAPPGLESLSPAARHAFTAALEQLDGDGAELMEVDIEPLLAAGEMLYGGAFLAERYAAVGEFIAAHRDDVDPTVAEIILGGQAITGAQYVADRERLDRLALTVTRSLAACDALLLPTVPFQPTLAEVAADPYGPNRRLGLYTSFANLLDMCAVAVPAGRADGGSFGVTLLAPAFHDRVAADLAARVAGDMAGDFPAALPPAGVRLLVLGAHMSDQPLNFELLRRGARLIAPARTAPRYRLFRLATEPAKPGLERVRGGGASITGELWEVPAAGLASLLSDLPSPMTLGRVSLEDGTDAVGFLCESIALEGAREISGCGGWREHLSQTRRALPAPGGLSR